VHLLFLFSSLSLFVYQLFVLCLMFFVVVVVKDLKLGNFISRGIARGEEEFVW